jgi:hypothetical protein
MNLQLKKWQTFEGNYRAYYSLVNSGKSNHKLPMETVMMKTDHTVFLLVKGVSFVTIKLRDWKR